jgi:hypothetical protein
VSTSGGRDRCGGCTHPERAQLDAALVSGVSLRQVARKFGISTSAAHRHQAHVPRSLVRVTPVAIVHDSNGSAPATAEDVLAGLQRLYQVCSDALVVASESGNVLQLALASRELRGALEVMGKHIERLEARRGAPPVDIWSSKAWQGVASIFMRVTVDHDKEHGHARADSIKRALADAFAEYAKQHPDDD